MSFVILVPRRYEKLHRALKKSHESEPLAHTGHELRGSWGLKGYFFVLRAFVDFGFSC